MPRLKSSLGCKEGAWHTIREAKRQLHFVVSSKSLSARERVQVIRFFEREHHGRVVPLPLPYHYIVVSPLSDRLLSHKGKKRGKLYVAKEPFTRDKVSRKARDKIAAI